MGLNPFDWALNFTLRWEGGYSDDPDDRGGATNKGVTQKTYDAWRKGRSLEARSVRAIDPQEVEEIYFEMYWQAGKCDQLPPLLGIVHFDACVNHGPGLAAKLLQAAMSVPQDGRIGPVTLGAAAGGDPEAAAQRYVEERRKFYREIVARNPVQGKFFNGWMNRMSALEAEVRAAAQA